MSVLIKNMEMPKNCGECQFCHTENFKQWCCPTGREDIFYDAMPEWCPLEKPKTGEWIENDNGTFSCSNCQSWIPKEQHHYARHCLYCGARMESDEQ